jgi:beta-lactam-binding protein with PASTA domain
MGWVSQVQDAIEGFRRAWSGTRRFRDVLIRLLGIAVLVVAIAWVASFGRSVTVPDVEGMNVRSAVKEMSEAGLPIEADGVYGIVTKQRPPAGERWYQWQDLTLTYEYGGEELVISGG